MKELLEKYDENVDVSREGFCFVYFVFRTLLDNVQVVGVRTGLEVQ